ncbi:hypothetical protein GJ744_009651 [Endocarpon pusillum]|uniref:Uncharacterized protein n=1 Tax=Endocarpon pusillum TaxID=364733 RepID=A0A8H7AIK6_9EURO|nr:hypothetical protein GJ744_009651 [Endocarpon pusillum]
MEDCVFLHRIHQARGDAENVDDELWEWAYGETELYWAMGREDEWDTRKTRAMRTMGMTRTTGTTKTGRTSEDKEDDQGGVQVRKGFNPSKD